MKKLSTKIKYLTISAFVVIATFAFVHNADAWSTQYLTDCSDGTANGIITNASLLPNAGPFPINSGDIMNASAMVTTTCASETVKVTVANNDDIDTEIISSTLINPSSPAFSINIPPLSVPAAANTYYVHFKTWVEEAIPPAFNITVENSSLDINVLTAQIDGVEIPIPGGFPFGPTGGDGGPVYANMSTGDIVSVYVEWFSIISAQHIRVTDTYGTQECTLVEVGDPDPTYSFKDMDMTGPSSMYIEVADGPC